MQVFGLQNRKWADGIIVGNLPLLGDKNEKRMIGLCRQAKEKKSSGSYDYCNDAGSSGKSRRRYGYCNSHV